MSDIGMEIAEAVRTRKMATIRRIDGIDPIEGADAIEVATIGGWKVVVKKGEFRPNDLAVYCEIDSWIPSKIAPFLTKPGHYPKTYEGIEGERLRTIKLRGQVSQGLLLHMSIFDGLEHGFLVFGQSNPEDVDVSDILGIIKYEPPIAACLAGTAKGNFPSSVPKTDQERIQNLKRNLERWKEQNLTFEVTEKLDGSSCTMYLDDEDQLHVCSRNLDLKEVAGNSFWNIARLYGVEENMRAFDFKGLAIQGELIGNGIQGNKYGLSGHDFYVFDIYDVRRAAYLNSYERDKIVEALGLRHAPTFEHMKLTNETIESLLKMAEGKSVLNQKTEREGLVFKCIEDPSISFKAISNRFLLRGGE